MYYVKKYAKRYIFLRYLNKKQSRAMTLLSSSSVASKPVSKTEVLCGRIAYVRYRTQAPLISRAKSK